MSRQLKTFFVAVALFVLCAGLLLITAYAQGADPFHPRSRMTWLLGLVMALYAAIRLAMIFDRSLNWFQQGKTGRPYLWRFGFLNRSAHPIDQRMAERRARVQAARHREQEGVSPELKETGDE